jgi:FkbM family methyltransferase
MDRLPREVSASPSTETFTHRAFRWTLRLIPADAWLPILSGPARGLRWRVGSAPHAFWLGRHEAHLIQQVWPRIPSGGVAWDLGGHAGYYTLMLARRFSHVHAFEPFPADLSDHVARNHLESRVTVHAHAVSDFNGTATMIVDGACSRIDSEGSVPVSVVKLDDVDLPDPIFVKIDIECQEAAALRGMRQRLLRSRPTLLVAIHSEQLQDESVGILESCGYLVEFPARDTLFAVPRPG